ncbi:uncharacterized protein LOC135468908 [Liolophura sinensis]|uniref:uncharacterized protein LOC135468908 n=1 Tax=Liolophura sinensis TaxID=3198878 RepID=UPI0031580CF3
MYTYAMMSIQWFTLPFVSYGIWVVYFCDFLSSCQYIPSVGMGQPDWYMVVQFLATAGWIGMISASLLLVSSLTGCQAHHYLRIIPRNPQKIQQFTSILCFISAFSISTCVVFFLAKLTQSSPENPPHWSYATTLASCACILTFITGLRLPTSSSSVYESSFEKRKVGLL